VFHSDYKIYDNYELVENFLTCSKAQNASEINDLFNSLERSNNAFNNDCFKKYIGYLTTEENCAECAVMCCKGS
jgi:hypothetical protein